MIDRVFERLHQGEELQEDLSQKVEALNRSVMEVQKYELLTTNQYLQQMELLLSIIRDIQNIVECH